MKRFLPRALTLLCLLLALLGWRMTGAQLALEQRRPQTASLRWRTGELTAADCRRMEDEEQEPPIFAAWDCEERELLEAQSGRKERAQSLLVRGDVSLLLPRELLKGDFPTAAGNLALSEDICYALFGSTDVIGKTVWSNQKEYTVSGVLERLQRTAVFMEPQKESFLALELAAPPDKSAYAAADELVARYALPQPAAVFNYAGRYSLKVPQEWIPNRWSDFEHWSTLIKQGRARRRARQTLPQREPDRIRRQAYGELSLLLGGSVLLTAAALLLLARELRRVGRNLE